MEKQFIDTLVSLFGDGLTIQISPQELRDAISLYPDLRPDALVSSYQRLIPDLLRRGIWFQRDGRPNVQLTRTSHIFSGLDREVHHGT